MSIDKFQHLDKKVPDIKGILKTPVHEVHHDKLWKLSDHFKGIQDKFSYDAEVVNAAGVILTKIDNIVGLWNNRVSWEIMNAANNENYLNVA